MKDEKLKSLLNTFNVPDAPPEIIESAVEKARQKAPVRIPTKAYSLARQIKVQATYLSKWFYISCGFLLLMFAVLGAVVDFGDSMENVFFCFAPLLIIPCAFAVHRTYAEKMFELEAVCKYSFSKIVAGKMLMLGGVVTMGLVLAWLLSSVLSHTFAPTSILMAMISFSITCGLILWFGRRNIVKGFITGSLWGVVSIGLKLWEVTGAYIDKTHNLILFLILIVCICLACLSAANYLRKSIEEGDFNWNYA